jgi:hypothetical protein
MSTSNKHQQSAPELGFDRGRLAQHRQQGLTKTKVGLPGNGGSRGKGDTSQFLKAKDCPQQHTPTLTLTLTRAASHRNVAS